MTRLLAYEWAKWWSRRDTRATAATLVLLALAWGALLGFLLDLDVLPDLLRALAGVEPTGFHLAFGVTRSLVGLLGVFLLVWSSASVAGELEAGTLRVPLLRCPRSILPAAKLLVLVGAAAPIALLVLGAGLAAGAWSFGLAGVDAGAVTLHSAGTLLLSGLVGTLLSLLPLASFAALGICLSCWIRGPQAALTTTLLVALVLAGLTLLPGVGGWIFPSTATWPLDVARSQAEGLKTLSYPSGLGRHLLVNLGWTAGLLGLGTFRFLRKDLG